MGERIVTPVFRAAFAKVHKAEAFQEGGVEKFSVVMLFDSTEDLSKLKNLAKAAIEEKWPDIAKRPKGLRNPFRKGEEKPDLDGYEGKIFVAASSKFKPGIVDKKREPILDETEFYSGCYARATIIAYAYSFKGNVGVSFGLQNLQKVAEGDKFGGGAVKAENDFDVFDTGDDNALGMDEPNDAVSEDDMFG